MEALKKMEVITKFAGSGLIVTVLCVIVILIVLLYCKCRNKSRKEFKIQRGISNDPKVLTLTKLTAAQLTQTKSISETRCSSNKCLSSNTKRRSNETDEDEPLN